MQIFLHWQFVICQLTASNFILTCYSWHCNRRNGKLLFFVAEICGLFSLPKPYISMESIKLFIFISEWNITITIKLKIFLFFFWIIIENVWLVSIRNCVHWNGSFMCKCTLAWIGMRWNGINIYILYIIKRKLVELK